MKCANEISSPHHGVKLSMNNFSTMTEKSRGTLNRPPREIAAAQLGKHLDARRRRQSGRSTGGT